MCMRFFCIHFTLLCYLLYLPMVIVGSSSFYLFDYMLRRFIFETFSSELGVFSEGHADGHVKPLDLYL